MNIVILAALVTAIVSVGLSIVSILRTTQKQHDKHLSRFAKRYLDENYPDHKYH